METESSQLRRDTNERAPDTVEKPDVEVIMAEVRRDAARAEGRELPPDDATADPGVYIGVDDQAVVRRVMERLSRLPRDSESTSRSTSSTPTPPAASATPYDIEGAEPRSWLHQQLGKCRRWLFRITKIQAALERLQERVNADMLELEQRTSQSVLQLQQYLTSPPREIGESGTAPLSLPDPLYQRLEARFRGSEEEIRERAREYLPFVREAATRAKSAGQSDLLDIGCGRGELLSLARDDGFSVRGIDSNHSMVTVCREKGLHVDEIDLRAFLLDCPEAAFRCVTLVHVIEHIHIAHLPALLVELKRVIASGGRLMMEFPNIANVLTASNYFYIDYTHHRPLHAETVKLFCEAAGFSGVFSHGLHPADESERLERVGPDVPGAPKVNATIDRLNALLYGPRDVLVVAER